MRGLGYTSAERWANLLFLISLILDLAGPSLVLDGVLASWSVLDARAAHALGFVIFGLAIVGSLLARRSMGGAWRTGIDPASGTPLITLGLFAVVRNPVYTTMIATSVAVLLLVPTGVALGAVALRVLGLEIQTRIVEEPYLLHVHGSDYREYACRVGRFAPLIGRWSNTP